MSLDLKGTNFRTLAHSIYIGDKKIDAIYMGDKKVYPDGSGIWSMVHWSSYPDGYDSSLYIPCYINTENIWTDGINTYCSMPSYDGWSDGESSPYGSLHYIFNKSNMSWRSVNISIDNDPEDTEGEWDPVVNASRMFFGNGGILYDMQTLYTPLDEPGRRYTYSFREWSPTSRHWSNITFDEENEFYGNYPYAIYNDCFSINNELYIYRNDGCYKLVGDSFVNVGWMGLPQGFSVNISCSKTTQTKYIHIGGQGVTKFFNINTNMWEPVTWTFASDLRGYDGRTNPIYLAENLYEINGVLYYMTYDWVGSSYVAISYVLDSATQTWRNYDQQFDDSVPEGIREQGGWGSSSDLPLVWTDGTDWYTSLAKCWDEDIGGCIYCQLKYT